MGSSEEGSVKREQLLNKINELGAKSVVEEDGFGAFDVQNPQGFLEWAAVNGYVFHDSTRMIIGELVPQQANDELKESGNREAVYMTRNPLLAMFTALTGGKDVGKRQNKCYMEITERGEVSYPQAPEFKVGRPEEVGQRGYVYIFDRVGSVDEEVNGEYLSYKPIEPLAVIRIEREDFGCPICVES